MNYELFAEQAQLEMKRIVPYIECLQGETISVHLDGDGESCSIYHTKSGEGGFYLNSFWNIDDLRQDIDWIINYLDGEKITGDIWVRTIFTTACEYRIFGGLYEGPSFIMIPKKDDNNDFDNDDE